MLRKLLISAFCVLNVVAVVVMNEPDVFIAWKERKLDELLPPQPAYRVRYAEWLVKRYAHLAGLDNRWTMFSTVHRFDWWYVLKALGPGGSRTLDLPRQSPRRFVDEHFFDHKEAKFHLNIYLRPDWRRAYARYLCRQVEAREGKAPAFVVYELHHQNFLDRDRALAIHRHLEADSHSQVIDAVVCGADVPPGTAKP